MARARAHECRIEVLAAVAHMFELEPRLCSLFGQVGGFVFINSLLVPAATGAAR